LPLAPQGGYIELAPGTLGNTLAATLLPSERRKGIAPLKIVLVMGTRPNFMKVAPIAAELSLRPVEFTPCIVHTGQHYDDTMSAVFLRELGLPDPDHYLDARVDGGHVNQVADIITKFDLVLQQERPDLVMVVGDVSSTLACATTAALRDLPLAHVEAGLRSGDRRLPEELNRLATDAFSDMLFTFSADADENLLAEAVPASSIFRVGNLMIDSLLRMLPTADRSPILDQLGVKPQGYAVATLHRQSNVEDEATLRGILEAFEQVQRRIPLVFQVHPRTRNSLERFGLADYLEQMPGVIQQGPMGYVDFLKLEKEACMALVDSGGVQEETTVLGVPCLTLRESTERPITVTEGTNTMVGCDRDDIVTAAFKVLDEGGKSGPIPDLWDGHSARRLVEVLKENGVVRR
jgi:UDP-N-acetylglucosamine 2-epimerase (non-hydrolysing)